MKKRRAITLIEVVISLAILGIIAMAFLPTFTTGIKNIFTTKTSTKDIYELEEDIDLKIKELEDGLFNNSDSSIKEKEIEVEINGKSITVPGKLIGVPARFKEDSIKKMEIKTFVPD